MTGYSGFRVDRDEPRGVVTITLDDPAKMNRVPLAARGQLAHLFAELAEDDDIRFVVLTGAGENFTGGGDIAAFMEAEPEHLSRLAWNVAAPERFPKPVIARIRATASAWGSSSRSPATSALPPRTHSSASRRSGSG
jgi:2-oxoglutaroyl-CoA hydrolase